MDGRKHTMIEAGGKIYNLRVSFNALAMFEDNVGPASILMGENAKPFYGLRGLVWAACNACGTAITMQDAGDVCEDYVAEHGLVAFQKKMQTLIDDAGWLSKGDGGGEKNQTLEEDAPSEN